MSKFTLYTTHIYYMHCGFTITVQGMAYYGHGHDTLLKLYPFSPRHLIKTLPIFFPHPLPLLSVLSI